MPSPVDLIDLDYAQVHLGQSNLSVEDQRRLENMITGASFAIEGFCQNALMQRTFTEVYARPTGEYMRLRKYPIVAVTSITDPALNTVPAADYLIIARTGSLRHLGYWPVPQNTAGLMAEWTVVYTAGRFATLVDVTDDLKLACVLLVSHRLIHVTPGVASKTAGELSVSYRDPESGDRSGLPADVQGLVWPYVSRAA